MMEQVGQVVQIYLQLYMVITLLELVVMELLELYLVEKIQLDRQLLLKITFQQEHQQQKQ